MQAWYPLPEELDLALLAFASALDGRCRKKGFIMVDVGPGGNGKSTLLRLLRLTFGEADQLGYAHSFHKNLLFTSANSRGSGSGAEQATPMLMAVVHKRFIYLEECADSDVLRSDRAKRYMSDTDPKVLVRGLYKSAQQTSFMPTIFICSNFWPRFDKLDTASLNRFQPLPARTKFVKDLPVGVVPVEGCEGVYFDPTKVVEPGCEEFYSVVDMKMGGGKDLPGLAKVFMYLLIVKYCELIAKHQECFPVVESATQFLASKLARSSPAHAFFKSTSMLSKRPAARPMSVDKLFELYQFWTKNMGPKHDVRVEGEVSIFAKALDIHMADKMGIRDGCVEGVMGWSAPPGLGLGVGGLNLMEKGGFTADEFFVPTGAGNP